VDMFLLELPDWHATWVLSCKQTAAIMGFVNYHHRENCNWRLEVGFVLAPAKTPPEIVTKLNTEIRAAVKIAAVRQGIVQAGYEPTDMSPAEVEAFLHADAQRYAEAVKAAKIEPQ